MKLTHILARETKAQCPGTWEAAERFQDALVKKMFWDSSSTLKEHIAGDFVCVQPQYFATGGGQPGGAFWGKPEAPTGYLSSSFSHASFTSVILPWLQ